MERSGRGNHYNDGIVNPESRKPEKRLAEKEVRLNEREQQLENSDKPCWKTEAPNNTTIEMIRYVSILIVLAGLLVWGLASGRLHSST